MNLRHLNIAPRALLCFGFFAVLITALGLFSLLQFAELKSSRATLQDEVLPAVQTIGRIKSDLLTIRLGNTNLRTALSPQAADLARNSITRGRDDLQADVRRLKPLLIGTDAQQAYGNLLDAMGKYLDVHARFLDALAQKHDDVATALSQPNGEQTLAGNQFSKDIDEVAHQADLKMAESDAVATTAYSQARNVTIAAILVALAATLIMATLFTRSLVSPVAKALKVAQQIADNDLSQPIVVDGKDEPGRLLGALAIMQDNLRKTLSDLGGSSNHLASTSEEMAALTQDALQGIQRQNDEINQAATAINQMSAAVEEVARNAALASSAARESSESAENGRQRVDETLEVINALHDSVGATASEIDGLALQLKDISGVLDVIRGVAEQTNLLALNAAIEAARAGDAGRGFAVVADEVRALAHRTQQSTAEIEQMITSIQGGASKAVTSMGLSSERAKASLVVAQGAGDALRQITAAIVQINERNVSIASATEEQAQVAREVDRNLTSIRDLSIQTSAGADQTSSASGELSRLAVQLNQVVLQFKV
ncbi:methyl-accepting chemotaxis protein [Pseudomonas eucalypticola]|uniref:Methyl-accepting chemotaxis protein n=1 Tax=Pseudomonas eucalypticola TaxID=2599595 RepID=A0A7D5H3X3_9PSED|nr:methyl-accepting chemotaxis protein [Pseudomonas eucalypticola]QKZ04962.1 methyl-accepting chemotaxis protein [Pseudomonas eucalypticola]